MKRLLIVLFVSLFSQALGAAWQLDNAASAFYFLSIKKNSIAEVHTFKRLDGSIGDDGQANLAIELASVQTGVDIRDQRMRDMLFEVSRFAQATAQLQVDPAALKALGPGDQLAVRKETTIDLHGVSKALPVDLLVTRLSDGSLQVQTLKPLLINANDFGLGEGIEALRAVVNLSAIDTVVPVVFNLRFR